MLAADVRGHVVLHEHIGHHSVIPRVAVAACELIAEGLLGPVHLIERERRIAPARLGLGTYPNMVGWWWVLNDERSAAYWAEDPFSLDFCEICPTSILRCGGHTLQAGVRCRCLSQLCC